MRALVLSGGAFRGAAQIPVIEHLQTKHDYDYVYGVSVGAINGAMVAQNKVPALRAMWENITNTNEFIKLKWYWPFKGLYSSAPLRTKIERFISLKDVQTPLGIGVESLTDREYYHLETDSMHTDLELWNSIQASSSIPGFMVSTQLQIDGRTHVGSDGGLYENQHLPIPPPGDIDIMDLVICTPIKFDGIRREISGDTIREVDIAALKYRHPDAAITIYSPTIDLGPSFYANPELISWRLNQGEQMILNPMVL